MTKTISFGKITFSTGLIQEDGLGLYVSLGRKSVGPVTPTEVVELINWLNKEFQEMPNVVFSHPTGHGGPQQFPTITTKGTPLDQRRAITSESDVDMSGVEVFDRSAEITKKQVITIKKGE